MDVREDATAGVAGAPEVDQFNVAAIVLRKEDVLWLHVAMNDAVVLVVDVAQGAKQLRIREGVRGYFIGDVLNLSDTQSREVVEAKNVKQVVVQLLKHEATVALVHKRVS